MMVKKRGREYDKYLYSSGDGAVAQGLANVLWGRSKREKLSGGNRMGHLQQGVCPTMIRVGKRRSRDEWDGDGVIYSDDDRAKRLMTATAAFPCGDDMTSATVIDDEGRSSEAPHMGTTNDDNSSNNDDNNNDQNHDGASVSGIGAGSDVLKDGVGAIKVHLPPGYHRHRHGWYPRDMIMMPNPSQSMSMGERQGSTSRMDEGGDGPMEDYMAPSPPCMAIVPYVGGSSVVTNSMGEEQGNVCPTGDAMRMDVDS